MYECKVKNHFGEVLNLSTSSKYTLYKITGLQPPASAVNTSNNATSDGVTINSVRVDKRNIVLYIALEGDVEANRINLYRYFPLKQTVTIYFKNGKRNVCIEGTVELINCDFFVKKQVVQVSVICPQPYFKAINDVVSYFSDVSALFQFPFSISETGIELSAITNNIRKSIINAGDVACGVIIELYAIGTVVNPIIYDVLKRTHIKLMCTMETGDTIVINTNHGQKSIERIRAGVSSNIMGCLYPTSTWLTLEAGDNVFTYDCETGNSNLQITMTTPVLYGGV